MKDIKEKGGVIIEYLYHIKKNFLFLLVIMNEHLWKTRYIFVLNCLLYYLTGVDPQWISSLRTKQLTKDLAQERHSSTSSNHSDSMTLPQFLSVYGNQSSYASAVRKSPNRSPLSRWADSRSSSPTLSTKLSSVHLGSKGSSPSSTTSESTSERDRSHSSRHTYSYQRKSSCNSLNVTGGGDRRVFRGSGHTYHGSSRGGRHRTNYVVPQSQSQIIPGLATETAGEKQKDELEDAKATEGGWIKVERKKPPKQDHKQQDQRQLRGRSRKGVRGGRGRS